MKEFSTVDEILDFAINSEQQAVGFYRELAAKSTNNRIRETFERFALEEVGHKIRLIKVKKDKSFNLSKNMIKDLKISDYIEDVVPVSNLSYQDALILAMKREKSAFKLYTNLATKTNNENLRDLFNHLAQEESKNKLMFELEYDEVILKDN